MTFKCIIFALIITTFLYNLIVADKDCIDLNDLPGAFPEAAGGEEESEGMSLVGTAAIVFLIGAVIFVIGSACAYFYTRSRSKNIKEPMEFNQNQRHLTMTSVQTVDSLTPSSSTSTIKNKQKLKAAKIPWKQNKPKAPFDASARTFKTRL